MTAIKRPRRVPLQLKLSMALVLMVIMPLGVAVVLIDQISRTAANVSAIDASSRIATMEKSIGAYHDLVDITKRLHAEIADRLSRRSDLNALDPKANLQDIIAQEPGLRGIALVRPDTTVVARAERPLPGPEWRDKVVDQPLGTSGAQLRLTFIVSATVGADLGDLKQSLDSARTVSRISSALPASYRTAFVVVIGIAGFAAAGFGVVFATFVLTRRIAALVSTARSVSDGKVDARVELRGHDELAELGGAFNTMLDGLEAGRQQIAYLQRMGAWEDVARRLAHEIKNPLTPIQLAVQQCVSSYKGAETDPVRYARTLADTGEIVAEEIASLRRLVDTFRTLGALPKVEKAPLALAEVIEELRLDPLIAARLVVKPPEQPVTVRADKLLLKRVLANLVENGIHAGQEAGHAGEVMVAWRTDPAGDVVRITVDDHGKGVAEADREKIFEPYVTTKSTGTGLGLAIARKIAIEHGGELSIAPERAAIGGARFVVSLPLRGPEASLG